MLEEESGCLTVKDGVGYAVEYSLSRRWHDDDFEALRYIGCCCRGNVSLLLLVVLIMRGTVDVLLL